MKILGIDYGRKYVGLATSRGPLSEPYRVIKVNSIEDAVEKVGYVLKDNSFNKVVVGISEGKMAQETRIFGKKLEKAFGIEIVYQDETLTSKDANRLSIEAGIKRKKRKGLEHAFSAALILQGYLDALQN